MKKPPMKYTYTTLWFTLAVLFIWVAAAGSVNLPEAVAYAKAARWTAAMCFLACCVMFVAESQ